MIASRRFRPDGWLGPWINSKVRKLIFLKAHALYKIRHTRSNDDWYYYRQLRNATNSAICHEKKTFLSSSLLLNSRQFWRNLSLLDAVATPASCIPNHLVDSSLLNNFIDSLPNSPRACKSPSQLCFPSNLNDTDSFSFSLISATQLYSYNIFKSIKLSSASPFDLLGRMILFCLPQCLDTLLCILNYSLSINTFPSILKQSVVIPIPKNSNPSSFCPISIPPFLSKLPEHLL